MAVGDPKILLLQFFGHQFCRDIFNVISSPHLRRMACAVILKLPHRRRRECSGKRWAISWGDGHLGRCLFKKECVLGLLDSKKKETNDSDEKPLFARQREDEYAKIASSAALQTLVKHFGINMSQSYRLTCYILFCFWRAG